MKASELIEALQKQIETSGDLTVRIVDTNNDSEVEFVPLYSFLVDEEASSFDLCDEALFDLLVTPEDEEEDEEEEV